VTAGEPPQSNRHCDASCVAPPRATGRPSETNREPCGAGPALSSIILAGVLSIAVTVPDAASAATYRIRTYSLGQATQTYRADRTASSRRIFTQGLDLRAYDLLGDGSGRLDAAVEARYTTDFTIPADRRNDAIYAHQWNDSALRLAYLDWQPTRRVEMRFGRQWSRGTLGIRDFDGAHMELRPRLDPATDGLVAAYAGRDIELGVAAFNTDDFDVQGLPANNDEDVEPVSPRPGSKPWLAGGRLGLDWGTGGDVVFSYRRRWRAAPDAFAFGSDSRTGSERFGVGATAVPHRRVTISTNAAYHTMLDAVDRASVDVAWNLPGPLGTLSTGLEHRRPWFDSSSIFNLFGTRPHQGGRVVYQHGVPALETEFQLRHWGRIYRGDPRPTGFERSPRKSTRLGGALAHFSDLFPFGHAVHWNSRMSLEADTAGRERAHLLADTRAKTPVAFENFFVSGRFLFLGALARGGTEASDAATTYVLGIDIPIQDVGTVHVLAERTLGSFHPPNTNLFGTLELEVWR